MGRYLAKRILQSHLNSVPLNAQITSLSAEKSALAAALDVSRHELHEAQTGALQQEERLQKSTQKLCEAQKNVDEQRQQIDSLQNELQQTKVNYERWAFSLLEVARRSL